MQAEAMELPEVNTGRLILRREQNSHFNTRLRGPEWWSSSFLLLYSPVFILFGFQQVCFHCSSLASNAHNAIFGKYNHFCFLSVNNWRPLIAVPPFQTVLRRCLPPLLKELGWSLMKRSLPNVRSLRSHSALLTWQSNSGSASNFSIVMWCFSVDRAGTLLKRSYFGWIRCLFVIKRCFKWFDQCCLHRLRK